METLIGKHIKLRALEPSDLDFLYTLENDESIWEVSNTQKPYSRYVLKKYLDHSHLDIYETKQVRFAISTKNNKTVGFVDLYDFDPAHKRVGVGIIVTKNDQKRGYAKEAIVLITNYAFRHLQVHQIFASVTQQNHRSIGLFEGLDFKKTGVRKDWIATNHTFIDEYFYQKIHVH